MICGILLGFLCLALIGLSMVTLFTWMPLDKDIYQVAYATTPPTAPPVKAFTDDQKKYDFFKTVALWGNVGAASLGGVVLIGLLVAAFRHKKAGDMGPPSGYDAGMPMDFRQ